MADKELLTELLEGVQALHEFLSTDLTYEHLSRGTELKRKKFVQSLSSLATRIRSSHPSIRPRMDTPKSIKLPAPKPPALKPPIPTPSSPPAHLLPTEDEGGKDMYVECEPPPPEPEDYLPFEPSQVNGDAPQDMYEEMAARENDVQAELYEEMATTENDVQSEVYEEPALVVSPPPDEPSERYEELEMVSPNLRHTPTPPSSRENSGSGAVYARTSGTSLVPPEPEVSLEWQYDYIGLKDTKVRAADLKGVVQKGYLEKLGGRNQKSWQKRYCVQASQLLYFYEKESSKSSNNRIALPRYVINVAPEHSNSKKKQFAFKLSHTDPSGKLKDYIFRAPSEAERQRWIQSIRESCETARTAAAARISQSVTLPRSMMSQQQPPASRAQRSSSVGDMEEEMYEDINPEVEEEGGMDEYVAVSPVDDGPEEEYVDVTSDQREEDLPLEDYEDTSSFQAPPPLPSRPPPPSSPPPSGAPPPRATSPLPSAAPPPDFAPPPPPHPPPPSYSPEPVVNTQKVYTQRQNGINLENVFVVLWDFVAYEQDELNLKRGNLLYVADPREDSDWWFGELLDEEALDKRDLPGGLFPRNYASSAFEPFES